MRFWPFGERKSVLTGSTENVLRALRADARAVSGQSVTTATAIRQSTVFACCAVLAQGVAQVPCALIQSDDRGTREAREHALWRILHDEPNSVQTSFEFREQMIWNLALLGNAYALKVRSLDGRSILELLPLPAQQVECRQTPDLKRVYIWRPGDGTAVEIAAENVWHLRGPSLSGAVGMAAVREAREAIGLSAAMENHAAAVFGRGALPSGVLSPSTPNIKAADIEALREHWAQQYSGWENAGKTAILPGPWTWTRMDISAVDAQLIEQRRFEIEEICRFYRVNPVMVMSSAMTQAYASIEQLFLAHVLHTLMPLFERFQQSARMNLLSESEKAAGYSIKLREQGLLRGAMRDQAEYWRALENVGVLNPNEIRELLDKNGYPGGDDYRRSANTVKPEAASER